MQKRGAEESPGNLVGNGDHVDDVFLVNEENFGFAIGSLNAVHGQEERAICFEKVTRSRVLVDVDATADGFPGGQPYQDLDLPVIRLLISARFVR